MTDVKVLNTLTGKAGFVPEALFLSTAFNKDGVFVEYEGEIDPDCDCNGQSEPEMEEPEYVPVEMNIYEEEV